MRTSGKWTIEGFFTDRPRSRDLFDHIREYIGSLGPVEIEVMKTQISFGTRRKFAWVWLPQTWIARRPEDCVALTFVLDRRIDDPRIEESVEARPGRWTHHIIIRDEGGLDATVRQWLFEAYEGGS